MYLYKIQIKNGMMDSYWPVLPLINHVGIFEDDVNTNLYGNESIDKITNTIDSDMNLIFNLNFNVDEVEELFDFTNTNTIRYSTDSLLLLDDNNRVFKETEDITDTIEKIYRRQMILMKVQWRRQSLFPSTQKPGVFPFSSSIDDIGDETNT